MSDTVSVPTAFTLFLELPFDLGFDQVNNWAYESGDPWPGWDLATMGAFAGLPVPVDAGTRPLYRLVSRRITAHTRDGNTAVESAFFSWIHGDLTGLSRWPKRTGRALARLIPRSHRAFVLPRWNRETHTVVAVTRFRLETLGADDAEGHHDAVHEALTVLNDFLTALGLMTDDPLVGAMSLTELPSVAPVVGQMASSRGLVGIRELVSVHPWQDALLSVSRTQSDLERSAHFFDAWHRQRDPTFQVLGLLHSAKRDYMAGRHAAAAISAGTAIEVLVETTISRCWEAVGLDPARLRGALQSGFKNQIEVHLQRVLGVPIDLDDPAAEPGSWWHGGYTLRNAVAHRGHRPSTAEMREALSTAYEFVAFIGRALSQNPKTRDFMGVLPTHRIAPQRYWFLAADVPRS